MADRWFYAGDGKRLGPFSATQLRALANDGQILLTDTVWKEGVARGVQARKVQYLFSAESNDATRAIPLARASKPEAAVHGRNPLPEGFATAAAVCPMPAPTGTEPDKKPSVEPTAAETVDGSDQPIEPLKSSNRHRPNQEPTRKGRVTSITGAIISSQDGTTLHYRKKCVKCGHQDNCVNRMPIRNGMTRTSFFCPKCRKLREVQIQGSL